LGKFQIASLFAAASLIALPAAAADLNTVHIPVAGKSRVQLQQEIDVAALQVCGEAAVDSFCVTEALYNAERQLDRAVPKASRPAKAHVAANDPTEVRISLKGKSRAQIFQEIDAAAQAVCASSFEQRECVDAAVSEAKRSLAANARYNSLAMN
jgi:hypothetical protein